MLPDHFFMEPMECKEVKKFRALLDSFDASWSYETGWEYPECNDFRAAYGTLEVQMMEILRELMARTDFEEIAKRSDEKFNEMRKRRRKR